MMRRSVLRHTALLVCLAFLLPLAAVADTCEDCLGGTVSACCLLPSCCSACAHNPTLLTPADGGVARPAPSTLGLIPRSGRLPASPPRDIFHVPKPSLL